MQLRHASMEAPAFLQKLPMVVAENPPWCRLLTTLALYKNITLIYLGNYDAQIDE